MKAGGTLPLLELPGVIFSHSFYLDAGALWTKRGSRSCPLSKTSNNSRKASRMSGRFLPGATLDKLLTQSGVHHRIVAAQRPLTSRLQDGAPQESAFPRLPSSRPYATRHMASIWEALVRGGVALVSTQVSVKLFDEKARRRAAVRLHVPRRRASFLTIRKDSASIFRPRSRSSEIKIIFASTKELCIELIDILCAGTIVSGLIPRTCNAHLRERVRRSAQRLASTNCSPQTILNQAVSRRKPKRQVDQLLKYLHTAGKRMRGDRLHGQRIPLRR